MGSVWDTVKANPLGAALVAVAIGNAVWLRSRHRAKRLRDHGHRMRYLWRGGHVDRRGPRTGRYDSWS
jgi:hypothetical protein